MSSKRGGCTISHFEEKIGGDVGPWALDPHHPPIFIPKPLNTTLSLMLSLNHPIIRFQLKYQDPK